MKVGLPLKFIICDNLEDLVATHAIASTVDLINFIANTKSLRTFEFMGVFDNSDILSLASVNMNVTEARFNCYPDVLAESIIQLITSSPNLKKLQIVVLFPHYVVSNVKLLNEITESMINLNNEWRIDERTDVILLEKIN